MVNSGKVATSSALRRLRRPPVTQRWARLGRTSTELRMRRIICGAVSFVYFDRNIGKTFCPNAAQWGQVIDEYSVIVTVAFSDPIAMSGKDNGLATAAAIAVCAMAESAIDGDARARRAAKAIGR